jgi:uncharacterized protein YdeI (BOF family)
MYLFADSTGEVAVEIGLDKFFGQSATPTTEIQIVGDIDKSMIGVKVVSDLTFVLVLHLYT